MTVSEAYHALGEAEPKRSTPYESCDYADLAGTPPAVAFMTSYDTIVRIEVDRPGIKTETGAEVGMTEDQIRALYPNHLRTEPHPYTGPEGHYLVYQPSQPGDTAYGLIFETDGKTIQNYRAGRRPEVEYIESCS